MVCPDIGNGRTSRDPPGKSKQSRAGSGLARLQIARLQITRLQTIRLQIKPSLLPHRLNFSIAKSRSSLVCAAEIMTRRRAFPRATVGYWMD